MTHSVMVEGGAIIALELDPLKVMLEYQQWRPMEDILF